MPMSSTSDPSAWRCLMNHLLSTSLATLGFAIPDSLTAVNLASSLPIRLIYETRHQRLCHSFGKMISWLLEVMAKMREGTEKGSMITVYNDISNSDVEHEDHRRPVLGGSPDYPYPRRCRTGRPRSSFDFKLKNRNWLFDKGYVPRDESFSDLKKDLVMNAGMKSFCSYFLSAMGCLLWKDKSFEDIEQVNRWFAPDALQFTGSKNPSRPITKFPKPSVIGENKDAWRSDREFGHQCLAGKILSPYSTSRFSLQGGN